MNITTLRKKARDGSLEVEHLLQAAVERQPGLSEELTRLSSAHDWKVQGLQPDGTRVVPFAKWAAVASAYASDEFTGLRTLARDPDNISFVLGLIEQIHTNESVSFLLEICNRFETDLTQFEDIAFRVAGTFNSLLSFKKAAQVTNVQARAIQEFLCALYPRAKSEPDKAVVLLALRGIGDRDAIQFIESASDFSESWASTKELVLRTVRKRVKTNAL
jgi:hypothetical protein